MNSADPIARLNAALSGRYRIERQLGEGGMATVYLADDLRHERKVALKVLKPELAAVVGAERFLAEIKTTANLHHPHILPLFDSGEADSFLFYVMPYVEGESLRERLDREHQLPVDEAVKIAKEVAEALQAAHERGVVHRDVKPANILLTEGRPFVSDFGIALALGAAGASRLTETGLSLGTPHYMSPEQATGDLSVGPATDIYALGCVLYEMLVGEPPYTGGTPQAVLAKIVMGEPDPASRHRRSVPPNVDGSIQKALEKVPADRFGRARDFAAAIEDAGFRYRGLDRPGRTPVRRVPLLAISITATIVALLVGGAAWMIAESGRSAPVARFFVELPGRLSAATTQSFQLDADGSAVFAKVTIGGRPQYVMRSFAQLEPLTLPGEVAGGIFLSPDGEWIGVNGQPPALSRMPISGGELTTVATGVRQGTFSFRGGAWGPDGTIVFASGDVPSLMSVSSTGGVPEPLTAPDTTRGEVHGGPHFLPDGRHLLFEIQSTQGPNEVALLDMETGDYSRLVEGRQPQYMEDGYLVFVRDDALWVARLDADRRRLRGEPALAIDGLGTTRQTYFVSRNGTLAYVPNLESSGPRSLVWVDRQGQPERLPVDPRPYLYPRISPDGERLAVVIAGDITDPEGAADLWWFDLDRLGAHRITLQGNNRYYPVWRPDGTGLVHADGRRELRNRWLFSEVSGTGRADTIRPPGPRAFPTGWSPDGSTLVFDLASNGVSRDVFLLEPETGSESPLIETPFDERAATFSPNGRWLAYVSDKSGPDEVYAISATGSGPESLVSLGGGQEPVWSRDGKALFYRTPETLMVVDIEPGPTFRAGAPRVLFSDPFERSRAEGGGFANYDVSADGERFIMILDEAAPATSRLVIVQNWVEEVRALLGR